MIDRFSSMVNFTNPLAKIANFADAKSVAQSVSPTVLCPSLPVNTTRCYTQLLRFMFYTVCHIDQRKSIVKNAARRMLMKLTSYFQKYVDQ